MKQSTCYLLLCIAGIVAPWLFLFGFFGDENASIPFFFASIFANHAASAVAADLVVSAIVFFVFVFIEGRRMGLRHLWIYIFATLFIGLSFGIPLFLSHRARANERRSYPVEL